MSFTPSAAWLNRARRSSVRPVVKAELRLPYRQLLRVTDATLARTSGLQILIQTSVASRGGFANVSTSLVEGIDFTIAIGASAAEAAAVIVGAIEGLEISYTDVGSASEPGSIVRSYFKARRLAPGGWDVTGQGTSTTGGSRGDRIKVMWSENSLTAERNGAVRGTNLAISISAGSGVAVVSGYQPEDLKMCTGALPWNHRAEQRNVISDVAEVGQQLDPIERTWSGSDLELAIVDDYAFAGDHHPYTGDLAHTGRPYPGTIRRIVTDHALLQKRCDVWLTFEELDDENDDVALGTYLIKDAIPEDGVIRLRAEDAMRIAKSSSFAGSFLARHPIDIAKIWLELSYGTGAGALVNYPSFDPDIDTTKSHWSISMAKGDRLGPGARPPKLEGLGGEIDKPQPVEDLINQVARVMNGTIRPKSGNRGDSNLGEITFIPNRFSDSASDTWDAIDDCEEFRVLENFSQVANSVSVNHARDTSGESDEGLSETLTFTNPTSIDQIGQRFEMHLDIEIINSFSRGIKKPEDETGPLSSLLPQGGLRGPHGEFGAASAARQAWGKNHIVFAGGFAAWRVLKDTDTHLGVDAVAHGFCGARFIRSGTPGSIGQETAVSGLTTGGAVERRTFLKLINDAAFVSRSVDNGYQETATPSSRDELEPEIIACRNSYHYNRDTNPVIYANDVVADGYAELSDGEGLNSETGQGVGFDDLKEYRDKSGIDRGQTFAYVVRRQLGTSIIYDIDGAYNSEGFRGGRGGLGTKVAESWNKGSQVQGMFALASVIDITIPKQLADENLARLSFGLMRVSTRTRLDKIGTEIADLVAIDRDDRLFGIFEPFASVEYIWEVTKREVRVFDDSPGIDWDLTLMRKDNFLFEAFTRVPIVRITPGSGGGAVEAIVDNALVDVYIDSDLDLLPDTPVVR